MAVEPLFPEPTPDAVEKPLCGFPVSLVTLIAQLLKELDYGVEMGIEADPESAFSRVALTCHHASARRVVAGRATAPASFRVILSRYETPSGVARYCLTTTGRYIYREDWILCLDPIEQSFDRHWPRQWVQEVLENARLRRG